MCHICTPESIFPDRNGSLQLQRVQCQLTRAVRHQSLPSTHKNTISHALFISIHSSDGTQWPIFAYPRMPGPLSRHHSSAFGYSPKVGNLWYLFIHWTSKYLSRRVHTQQALARSWNNSDKEAYLIADIPCQIAFIKPGDECCNAQTLTWRC